MWTAERIRNATVFLCLIILVCITALLAAEEVEEGSLVLPDVLVFGEETPLSLPTPVI